MTTKPTIVLLLTLMILGFGISQIAYAEEATKIDPSTSEGAACMEQIQNYTLRKNNLSEADRQRIIGSAITSEEFKSEVGNDSYKYGVITTGWSLDPKGCTSGLLSSGVHFRATDENGETREVIVSVDPFTYETKAVRTISDKDRPTHGGVQVHPTLNYAGYVLAGNGAETEPVLTASLMYDVPTPNDPAEFNCGTTASTSCWASVWTGLTTNAASAEPMVQTGTDSECRGNNCANGRIYHQWFETVNASGGSTPWNCETDLEVSAGDTMYAQVTNDARYAGSNADYHLFLVNISENLQCVLDNQSADYGDPTYGLYVYERVNIGSTYLRLAEINDIADAYGTIYYDGSTKGIYTPYNNGWATKYEMWASPPPTGPQNADATAIGTNSKFTFEWLTSEGTD